MTPETIKAIGEHIVEPIVVGIVFAMFIYYCFKSMDSI